MAIPRSFPLISLGKLKEEKLLPFHDQPKNENLWEVQLRTDYLYLEPHNLLYKIIKFPYFLHQCKLKFSIIYGWRKIY